MINIGLIGYGYWGKILARYFDASPAFELRRIFGRSIAKEGKFTNEMSDILADPAISAVAVATPIGTHYGIVKQALAAGKHVFCEKPLCLIGEQARELKLMAMERNLTLFVDFTYTFSRSLSVAGSFLSMDEIGSIERIELSMKKLGKFTADCDVRWVLGSHALSILSMFWPLSGVEFWSDQYTKHDGRIEAAYIGFADGRMAGRIDLNMNYPGKHVELALYGEKGTILCQPFHDKWTLRVARISRTEGSSTPPVDIHIDEGNNLFYVVGGFAGMIDYSSTISPNLDTAVKITEILERLV